MKSKSTLASIPRARSQANPNALHHLHHSLSASSRLPPTPQRSFAANNSLPANLPHPQKSKAIRSLGRVRELQTQDHLTPQSPQKLQSQEKPTTKPMAKLPGQADHSPGTSPRCSTPRSSYSATPTAPPKPRFTYSATPPNPPKLKRILVGFPRHPKKSATPDPAVPITRPKSGRRTQTHQQRRPP